MHARVCVAYVPRIEKCCRNRILSMSRLSQDLRSILHGQLMELRLFARCRYIDHVVISLLDQSLDELLQNSTFVSVVTALRAGLTCYT